MGTTAGPLSTLRPLFAVLVALGLCLPVAAVLAADSAEKTTRVRKKRKFEERTQVIEVQVPVNVVTRNGEPVRDLTADDFEVFDDGIRREIVDFKVVDLAAIDPGRTRVEIEAAVPPGARRHFLLLFDLSFSSPASVIKAREAAREFVLSQVHPTDLVAVALHAVDTGARLLVTFTPDRAQAVRAIDTLGAPHMIHLARRDPLSFLIDEPASASLAASTDVTDVNATGPESGLQQSLTDHLRIIGKEMAKMERSFLRGRVSSWSHGLGNLARFLASINGRKHVVYFSEGFDGRLLLGREPAADDPEFQEDMLRLQFGDIGLVDTDQIYGNTSLQSEVGQMLEEFRRADCIIQAVDISGLQAGGGAELRARGVGQDALFYIANDTGGNLFENANNFGGQLASVLERTAVTYVLTFEASDIKPDGAFRPIRVKADLDQKARLTYRRGYYAPRSFEELHPLEKNLLASDAIASAAPIRHLGVNVLAAPFRAGGARAYVPVIIEVQGESLLDGHSAAQLPIEFYAYVTDSRGEMKDFFSQMVTVDLSRRRAAFAATGLKYYGHLELEPGDYLVRVLIRNAQTGRTGLETLPLTVPALEDTFVLPPFFLEIDRGWFLVRQDSAESYQATVVYPFTVNGDPYIPAALPELKRGDEARICLVGYNLGAGELDIDAMVLARDGRPVTGGRLSLLERTVTGIEGLDKLLATFRPDGLDAGRYTLEVAISDRASGLKHSNSIPFTVLN